MSEDRDRILQDFMDAMVYSVLNRRSKKGRTCPECGSKMVETQTLHTEDEKIEFYECENCGHPQTV